MFDPWPIGTLGDDSALTDLIPPAPTDLGQVLTDAGLPNVSQSQVQNAVAGYTGLSVQSQNALLQAAKGVESGGVNLGTLTPLLAAGFAAVGLAPLAAALAVGLPVAESIAQILDPAPHCDWTVGAMCITQPLGRPYGPTDVARWVTFEQWYAEALAVAPTAPGGSIESFIAGLNSIKLPSDWPTPTTPQDIFLAVYRAAWRQNAEFLINGYNWLDPYLLLTTLASIWNSTHAATSTYTFTNADTNYIGYLIKGVYGTSEYYAQNDEPPVTINVGAELAPPPSTVQEATGRSPAAASSSPTTAGNVARVAVVAAVAGGAIWAVTTGKLAAWLKF